MSNEMMTQTIRAAALRAHDCYRRAFTLPRREEPPAARRRIVWRRALISEAILAVVSLIGTAVLTFAAWRDASGAVLPWINGGPATLYLFDHCVTCDMADAITSKLVQVSGYFYQQSRPLMLFITAAAGAWAIAELILAVYSKSEERPKFTIRTVIVRLIIASAIFTTTSVGNIFSFVSEIFLNPLVGLPFEFGKHFILENSPATGLMAKPIAYCLAIGDLPTFTAPFAAYAKNLNCALYAAETNTWWPLIAAFTQLQNIGSAVTSLGASTVSAIILLLASLRACAAVPLQIGRLLILSAGVIITYPIYQALWAHPRAGEGMVRWLESVIRLGLFALLLSAFVVIDIAVMDALVSSLGVAATVEDLINKINTSSWQFLSYTEPSFWSLLFTLAFMGSIPGLAAEGAAAATTGLLPRG